MSLVQRGAGCHILSISLYNYVTGMSLSDIIVGVDEVPDFAVKEIIQEVYQFSLKHDCFDFFL